MGAGDQLPEMPFRDVVGKGFNTEPEQIAATGLNAGVTLGFTFIVSVAVVAHWPVPGVNVYVVVAVLFKAGVQLPGIPFNEVVGRADKASPEQIAATELNVGVIFGVTVIVNVVAAAHCPALGVKV